MSCSSFLLFTALFGCLNAGSWTEQEKQDLTLLGVGINTKAAAYAGSIENGVGAYIIKSTDLGVTWTKLIENDGLLNIGCSSNSNLSAVLASPVGKGTYTIDGGMTFYDSKSALFGAANIAKSRVNTDYGAACGAGICITSDLGNIWKHHNANGGNLTRYAALPSENTWYLSAGIWEDEDSSSVFNNGDNINSKNEIIIDINSKIRLIYNKNGNNIKMENKILNENKNNKVDWSVNKANKYNTPKNMMDVNDYTSIEDNYGMWGAIWKTSDGGNTWEQSYSNGGAFYFNQIDCCSEDLCYAVAEGDTESGSNSPGARIFNTNDGGKTWTQQYYVDNDAASLTCVRCINENEAWAAGGTQASNDYNGVFLHTMDGGNTWNATTVNYAIMWMDMTNDNNYGIANGLTKEARSVVYAYQ